MSVNLTQAGDRARDYEYVLVLMRHAKAEKESDSDDDSAREITDKGRKQAKRVAKALDAIGLNPDAMAVSGAKRARQTADRMLKVFGDKPEVAYHKKLYTDGMQGISDVLSSAKKKVHSILVVGHEPSISLAAQWWAHDDDVEAESDYDTLQLGLSPAAFVILGAHKPFNQWDLHQADVIATATAKDCE